MPQALQKNDPKNFLIPLALLAATLFLGMGLFLPVITLRELVFWKTTFSVVSGIQSLYEEKHYVLACIIFFFSLVFPIFKLVVLCRIWFTRLGDQKRKSYLNWLGILGKWSMLDVFVVAVMIVVTKISGLAKAEARLGIYFFAVSILLAMILTEYFERLIKKEQVG